MTVYTLLTTKTLGIFMLLCSDNASVMQNLHGAFDRDVEIEKKNEY